MWNNMMRRVTTNKLYIANISLLCTFTYLLNCCTAIYQCALIFTLIAITLNITTLLHGKTKGLIGLSFATIINFVLLWRLPYYIDGKIVKGLIFASFVSLMISLFVSTTTFFKFSYRFGFIVANALSLAIAAIIDGFIMGLFFAVNNNFSLIKVLDIFTKAVSFKIFYCALVSAVIFAAIRIFKTNIRSKAL